MDDQEFNSKRYIVTDANTGELVPVDIFIKKVSGDYWEKAYASVIADYINIGGTATNEILADIIKNKNADNLFLATTRELAEKLDVAPRSVAKVFKRLQEEKLMLKVKNGRYLISPKIMVHGSKTRGAMVMRLWEMNSMLSDEGEL